MQSKDRAQKYIEMVEKEAPKSKTALFCLKAFVVGGAICCIGQGVYDAGENLLHLSDELLSAFTAISMVFLGATLTGIGVYDKLGKFAGAGSVVPITGFANSVVSPAIEFKSEGHIMGIGARMFIIAGPVLVFGVISSIVVGLISLL